MATPVGPQNTFTAYDLTTGVVVDMDSAIYLVDPEDSPLLGGIGADGLSLLSSQGCHQTRVDWMDEQILLPRCKTTGTSTTTQTAITVAAGDELRYSTGDIIMVGPATEWVQVTSIASGVLTVTRAYGGTSATIATSTQLIGVGTALAEGSDPEKARMKDRNGRFNITQIFGPTAVTMSRTEQRVQKYGVANEFDHQLMNRITENVISREQALLYGVRADGGASGSGVIPAKVRTMGGLLFFIQANGVVDSTSTQLTVANLQNLQQTLYNAGKVPGIGMGNPYQTKNLSATTVETTIHEQRSERARGRQPAQYVDTEFGRITLVRNRYVDPAHFFMYSREQVIRRILDTLQFEVLAKTGDRKHGQIVCEETLEVKGAQHMAVMSTLS